MERIVQIGDRISLLKLVTAEYMSMTALGFALAFRSHFERFASDFEDVYLQYARNDLGINQAYFLGYTTCH
jgi:hypothetical protein